jgi:hypothetical protein
MFATEGVLVSFHAMADHRAAAMFAPGRKRLDRALETIKRV